MYPYLKPGALVWDRENIIMSQLHENVGGEA